MLANTRDDFIPTYLVLGLATVCARSAAEQTGLSALHFDRRFIKMMVFGSLAAVAILYVFMRVTVRWSS